uniref:Ig-like domain-containing protein n=1 Tax=Sparus aurata TaxID=8175 RepID=A0A671Y244_SPAAU
MTSLRLVFFHLTCLFLGIMAQTASQLSSSVHPDGGFLSVKTGGSLTLPCFYKADVAARLYWYKQPLGQKLQLIAAMFKFDKNGTFYGEFKNNPRFTLVTGDGKNHLKISDLRISDSAAYNCMSSFLNTLETSESITVSVTVDFVVLVYFLSGALTFTTILVVLLALLVFKMKKRNSYQSAESQARLSAPSATNAEGHRDADNLHYSALSVKLPNRSRRQKNNTNNECVYSSVKL